jgi:hypothetical protein
MDIGFSKVGSTHRVAYSTRIMQTSLSVHPIAGGRQGVQNSEAKANTELCVP